MEEVKQLQNELKMYGFDDHKLDILMALAYDEFMAQFEEDLTQLELEDLESIQSEMTSLTLEQLMEGGNKIEELLSKVYGLQSKNKVVNFVKDYLTDAITQAKVAKDIMTKAQSGDTSLLNQANDDPNKQAIEEAFRTVSDL